jgi:plasmid stability protein
MSTACDNVPGMVMIQMRNVPEDLHRKLKVRAAEKGLTLSDYLIQMAERDVSRPTIEELSERIRRRGRVKLKTPAAEIIRELRDEMG